MRAFVSILLFSAGLAFVASDPAQAHKVSNANVNAERLRGGNENPPVISDGFGRFRAKPLEDRIAFRLRYESLVAGGSDVTQAHLHIANPGNNGGIVVFLCSNLGNVPAGATARLCPPSAGVVDGDIVPADVQTLTEDGTTIIGAGDLAGLVRLIQQGSVYANVHTVDHPGGEIRGQLAPRDR